VGVRERDREGTTYYASKEGKEIDKDYGVVAKEIARS